MAGDEAIVKAILGDGVSIHARAWRATASPSLRYCDNEFQFTPAHGGRQLVDDAIPAGVVSIHARAWRATRFLWRVCGCPHVSIHARAWRATGVVCGQPEPPWFQFTPAHGGRLVSLKASTVPVMFQFTPAHGGRPAPVSVSRYSFVFQFTPAHGGRPSRAAAVSIHARAWRATIRGWSATCTM